MHATRFLLSITNFFQREFADVFAKVAFALLAALLAAVSHPVS